MFKYENTSNVEKYKEFLNPESRFFENNEWTLLTILILHGLSFSILISNPPEHYTATYILSVAAFGFLWLVAFTAQLMVLGMTGTLTMNKKSVVKQPISTFVLSIILNPVSWHLGNRAVKESI